ncbi:MAG: PAS domain-containing protein [Rhodospirillaceae bacterium]|nr:PAS domain-containing protein [Rhodospirillaceae bacterium]
MATAAYQTFRGPALAEKRFGSAAGDVDKTRLLALAESVGNMGHWYLDLATGAVSWSDQIYRIAGREPTGAAPNDETCWDVVHPDDRDMVLAAFDRASASKSPVEFDARLLRPSGEVRNVIIKCQPELNDGTPVALFGVMTDVTDAFSAIRAIQDQHEMLDLAAELAHLGHWVWSAHNDSLTFCSEQLARIHELTPDVFIGRFSHPSKIASSVEPEFRDAYRSAIARALSEGASYEIEYKLETRFATSRHIKEIGQPIFDEHGKLIRFIGTVQDISEVKRRELLLKSANDALETQTLALKRSETKFRDIVEGSLQGIVVIRRTRIVFANSAFARMLGVSAPEEVTGLDDVRRILPQGMDADINLFWNEALARRLDGHVQRSLLRSIDGRSIWVDAIGKLVDWEGGPCFLMTFIDVTARHMADQALVQKSRELEELNLQKDKLFSIIAHDLKGPFNSVLGFAGLLASKAANMSPEKIAEYADIVYSAATNVHDLLDNLLAWASVQMRSTEVRFTSIELKPLVDASFYPLKAMAAEKGVAVLNDVSGIGVEGDESMIRIVLRNLISNGIKFTPRGGTVTVSAALAETAAGPAAVAVTVRDNGVGMNQETLSELFSFSRKVSRSGTQGERGTGLGLFLCRDIVERHGGVLTVESKPGQGTAFRFTLPLRGAPVSTTLASGTSA